MHFLYFFKLAWFFHVPLKSPTQPLTTVSKHFGSTTLPQSRQTYATSKGSANPSSFSTHIHISVHNFSVAFSVYYFARTRNGPRTDRRTNTLPEKVLAYNAKLHAPSLPKPWAFQKLSSTRHRVYHFFYNLEGTKDPRISHRSRTQTKNRSINGETHYSPPRLLNVASLLWVRFISPVQLEQSPKKTFLSCSTEYQISVLWNHTAHK